MSWPLAISVDVGGRFGIGHLKRCIAIGQRARTAGANIVFHHRGDSEVTKNLVVAGGLDWAETDDFGLRNRRGVVLVDRVHGDTLTDPRPLVSEMSELRAQGSRVALLDGAGEASLYRMCPALRVELFIMPYAGEEPGASANRIAGPSYAPLMPEYAAVPPRSIAARVSRILVSCGGSDPARMTAQIVAAVAEIKGHPLVVSVILGPAFDQRYCNELRQLAAGSFHTFEWIDAPASLAPLMMQCDLAIAASGLTKYELAATGTPAIVLSPDAMHDTANKPFAALGTCIDLGVVAETSRSAIASAIEHLLDDEAQRTALSRAGQAAIDGRGSARIAAKLRELADASS